MSLFRQASHIESFHVGIGTSIKIRYVSYVPGVGACGVHWAHVPINVIYVYFKDNHFEFRVTQEVTQSHIDFSVSSLDSSSRKHGF